MAKDPAFLFYANDWAGGTGTFTFEQKGCYLELLLIQFQNGKFTEEDVKQVINTSYSSVWPKIKHKFETDGTYYWHHKMKEVIEKRHSFTESRRNNRLGKFKDTTSDKQVNNTRKTLVKLVGNGNGNRKLEVGNGIEVQIAEFENFRLAYGGRKDGYATELKNFQRHEDWRVCIAKLMPALEIEIAWRKAVSTTKKFLPNWANLRTWINQRRWDQTLPQIEEHELTRDQKFEVARSRYR